MKEFILNHWREILDVVVLAASIVLLCLKKPVKSSLDDSIKSDILKWLPSFILSVERPGDGEAKRMEVLTAALQFVRRAYKRVLTDDEESYWSTFIYNALESILSTPEKKEVKNG